MGQNGAPMGQFAAYGVILGGPQACRGACGAVWDPCGGRSGLVGAAGGPAGYFGACGAGQTPVGQ